MAYKLGYMDLFALAVERVAWAAAQADDPLLRPVAAMRRSSVFRRPAAGTAASRCWPAQAARSTKAKATTRR